jgi:hypothetical protein
MGMFLALPENIDSQENLSRTNTLAYFAHQIIKQIKKDNHKTP